MSKHKPIWRLAADIALVALVAWAPIWAIVVCAIAFAWLFAPYYELMIAGVAFDSLYGYHSVYATVFAFIIFVAIEIIRKRTRV